MATHQHWRHGNHFWGKLRMVCTVTLVDDNGVQLVVVKNSFTVGSLVSLFCPFFLFFFSLFSIKERMRADSFSSPYCN
jgi:hypothetical protein